MFVQLHTNSLSFYIGNKIQLRELKMIIENEKDLEQLIKKEQEFNPKTRNHENNRDDKSWVKNVLTDINEHSGIDLLSLISNKDKSFDFKLKELQRCLLKKSLINLQKSPSLLSDEQVWGKNLLQKNGELDVDYAVASLLSTKNVTNLMLPQEDMAFFKGLKGKELRKEVRFTINKLQDVMDANGAGMAANYMFDAGIGAIGLSMSIGTLKALAKGHTLLLSIFKGVVSVSLAAVLAATAIIIAAFLLWFFMGNKKNIFGLIINDTKKSLYTKGWSDKDNQEVYMDAGTMDYYPEDRVKRGEPWIQVKGKAQRICNGNLVNFFYVGYFFAEKKFGAFGAEGLFALKYKDSEKRIVIQFACPYHADNGTNIEVLDKASSDWEKNYDRLYKNRKVHATASTTINNVPLKIQSRVNDKRGGEIALISIISDS